MDSPVIVDTASKFGRDLDPGFPFDDEGFGRRHVQAHLDDLAARHPEFADHLLGPPWGGIPLHGTRRRGSGASHQSHQDEDARSQASGSSAASAASGASGVSSHGEPEATFDETQGKIPQYGLRNTVDIGQHQHNMQNQDKGGRNQRSMSAPPENRQIPEENQPVAGDQQSLNPRFVSRVDITPQFNNQTTEKSSKPQTQQQQPQQQKQPQSNVRHIPIFVEGRDKPVIPKDTVDEPSFTKQASPPKFHQTHFDSPPDFHQPPHFHRPSYFTSERFGGRPREWQRDFQDPFQGSFDHPTRRTQSPFRQQTERQGRAPEGHFPQAQQTHQKSHAPQQEKPQERMKQQQPEAAPEPPKPKQVQPKDPLERVALVQKEVDSLNEQVKLWNGTNRKDKTYIYLDEMLTRELIKLDDIETEGKEAVRQARKKAIKCIQDSISLLESKAPLSDQAPVVEPTQSEEPPAGEKSQESEPMETEKKPEEESKPIPLPPPSPTKESSQSQSDVPMCESSDQPEIKENEKTENNFTLPDPNVAIPMEAAPTPDTSITAMEIQTESQQEPTNEKTKSEQKEETTKTKSPKKVKKTKKQTPVSTEPIPLPGPKDHNMDVK